MRISTAALAAGAALLLSGFAQAADHHRHLARVVIRAESDWPVDYNIVPRYRYRPQDDRSIRMGRLSRRANLSQAELASVNNKVNKLRPRRRLKAAVWVAPRSVLVAWPLAIFDS
jgi:hypothetical protein